MKTTVGTSVLLSTCIFFFFFLLVCLAKYIFATTLRVVIVFMTFTSNIKTHGLLLPVLPSWSFSISLLIKQTIPDNDGLHLLEHSDWKPLSSDEDEWKDLLVKA